MTSNKNHKAEVRRIQGAFGAKYTEATRAVDMQGRGLLPKLPVMPDYPTDAYDPFHDTVQALIDVRPSGQVVDVDTQLITSLVAELTYQVGFVEPRLSGALGKHFGRESSFRRDAHANPIDRRVAERLVDVCAALAGDRLEDIGDWVFQGRILSSTLAVWVSSGAGIAVALADVARGDLNDDVAVLKRYWDSLQRP